MNELEAAVVVQFIKRPDPLKPVPQWLKFIEFSI